MIMIRRTGWVVRVIGAAADGEQQPEAPGGSQIARANHFVPRALLRRWSTDGVLLPTYSLLVPDFRVPLWSDRPLKSLAMHRDLYTSATGGEDSDETERWFAHEIEAPGLEASERLIDGMRLSREDWHAVIRLYALQEMRTPQSFIEQMHRWDTSLPEIIQTMLAETAAELQRAHARGESVVTVPPQPNPFSGIFRAAYEPGTQPGESGTISASAVAGRAMWIAGIRHILTSKPVDKLLRGHWGVLIPAPQYEWPLTDHPALRLAYASPNEYSFSGGWGRRNVDLLMPLSPRHLLHSQVGKTVRGFRQLSEENTRMLRRILVNRAFRTVFSTRPVDWIPRERPRKVNRAQFNGEQEALARWHEEQSRAESWGFDATP